jgi:hypothetical protein
MSLTALAASEVRRSEYASGSPASIDLPLTPEWVAEPTRSASRERQKPIVIEVPTSQRSVVDNTNVIDSLVKYIPVESTTLYLAAVSAQAAILAAVPFFTPLFAYWFFALLTPVLFLLILAGQRRDKGLTRFPPFRQLPWWKLLASFTAFLAWGLAIPSNPYSSTSPLRGAAFAFLALFVSTILSLLENLFEPKSA